jgi:hypothetical protein
MRPVKYDNSVYHQKARERSMENYEKRDRFVKKLRYLEKISGIEKTDITNMSNEKIKELIKDLTIKKLNEKLDN